MTHIVSIRPHPSMTTFSSFAYRLVRIRWIETIVAYKSTDITKRYAWIGKTSKGSICNFRKAVSGTHDFCMGWKHERNLCKWHPRMSSHSVVLSLHVAKIRVALISLTTPWTNLLLIITHNVIIVQRDGHIASQSDGNFVFQRDGDICLLALSVEIVYNPYWNGLPKWNLLMIYLIRPKLHTSIIFTNVKNVWIRKNDSQF